MRLQLLFLCTLFLLVLGLPSDYFSKDDSQRLQDLVVKTQGKDGTWGSAANTHYAVQTLNTLGAKIPKSKEASSALGKLLLEKKNQDIATIYHAIQALDTVGQYDVPAGLPPVLRKSLDGDLLDIYYAAQTIFTLSAKNKIQLAEFDWSKVVSNLVELLDEEGGARSGADNDDASAANAGLVLQIIGGIFQRLPEQIEKSNAADVNTAILHIKELLELGFQDGGIDFSADSDFSNLAATSIVLNGLDSLADAVEKNIGVSESYLSSFASFFVSNKYVNDLESAFFLTQGLHLASDNSIHVPLVLSLVDSKPSSLSVKVTNVFGQPVPATVVLTQASGAGSVVLKDGSFTAKGDVLNLDSASSSWNSAKPGVYTLRFSVTPKGSDERYKQFTTARHVKVLGQIKDIDLEVFVSESAKGLTGDNKAQKISHPRQLSQKISASSDKYVHFKINFTPANFEPNQVFLQLVKDANAAIFVAQSAGNGLFTAKLSLASSDFQETIFGSGDYRVNAIIGDELLQHALIWEIGVITLDLPGPGPKSVEDPFRVFPEIQHQFQPAESRPPVLFSTIFTGLVALPFLWLLTQLVGSGVEWDVPTGAEWISALLFQVTLGGILGVYVIYWIALNIFEALALTALVGALAIVFGSRALKARHRRLNPKE